MFTSLLVAFQLLGQANDPPPPPKPAGEQPAERPVAEQPTRTDVEAARRALESDPVLAGQRFTLRIEAGKLVVEGVAASDDIRKRVDRLVARAVDPEYVVNKIRMAPGDVAKVAPKQQYVSPTESDEARRAELKRLVDSMKPGISRDLRYEVQTKPLPAIVIEGVVDTYADKLEISRAIRVSAFELPVLNNAVVRDRTTLPSLPPKQVPTKVVSPPAEDKKVAIDAATPPSDQSIAAEVKERILADKRVDVATVIIHVDSGIVSLRGVVGSQLDKVVVIGLAGGTPGVADVLDELRIEGTKGTAKTVVRATDAVLYFRRLIKRNIPHLDRAVVTTTSDGGVSIVIGDAYLTAAQLEDVAAYLRGVGDEIGVRTIAVVR